MIEEEYLARKYCEPKAYWHCLEELGELSTSLLLLNELEGARFAVQNYPERWLDAVKICTKRAPSPAAKQLHRKVEAARAEFKAKRDRIYGKRKVSETEGLEDIYRREDKAWNSFNVCKKDCLRAYLRPIETGKVETQRAKRRHRCQGEDCRELLSGRVKFCDICKRARNREAARVYRRRNQFCSVISFTREISPKNRAFGLPIPLKICQGNQDFRTSPGTLVRAEALTSLVQTTRCVDPAGIDSTH
jgi:hypothetical protein